MVIEKLQNGLGIHQHPYTKELLGCYNLDHAIPSTIWLDKSECADSKIVTEERQKEAQRLGGELLWLSTRTRPDIAYAVQRLSNVQADDPARAVRIGLRILRYLVGASSHGLLYASGNTKRGRLRDET